MSSVTIVPPFLPGQFYLLDGGFSSQLAKHLGQQEVDGDPLWTARSLVTNPDIVTRVHRDFLAAGARVLITNSYQVSVRGFKEHLGLGEERTMRAVRDSVELAWRAVREEGRVPGHVLVAGSVGPYGACRGDGSEYTGSYLAELGREELAAWHGPRVLQLCGAGVSCLALETLPHSSEALAMMDAVLQSSTVTPAWVSFTLKDSGTLGGGEGVEAAVKAVLAHPLAKAGRLMALGVNCSDPSHVSPALRTMRGVSKTVPLVVYPNSGEKWDGAARVWRGEAGSWLALVREWVALGAVGVGGCCRVAAETLPSIQQEMVRGLCQA